MTGEIGLGEAEMMTEGGDIFCTGAKRDDDPEAVEFAEGFEAGGEEREEGRVE